MRVRPQMPKGRDQTLSRKQHKPHILALPHPARTLGECDAVLFTKDPQREYKDKLAAAQVERGRVEGQGAFDLAQLGVAHRRPASSGSYVHHGSGSLASRPSASARARQPPPQWS